MLRDCFNDNCKSFPHCTRTIGKWFACKLYILVMIAVKINFQKYLTNLFPDVLTPPKRSSCNMNCYDTFESHESPVLRKRSILCCPVTRSMKLTSQNEPIFLLQLLPTDRFYLKAGKLQVAVGYSEVSPTTDVFSILKFIITKHELLPSLVVNEASSGSTRGRTHQSLVVHLL